MKSLYNLLLGLSAKLSSVPPLVFRLILAYGFYGPASDKLSNIPGTIAFFAELGIPAPEINGYMAIATECLGVLLLFLGLGTRIIAVPLMVVMIVAIKTVHLKNGFSCSDNGFEIPFYYLFMLFSLFVSGAGKFSLDHLIRQRIGE